MKILVFALILAVPPVSAFPTAGGLYTASARLVSQYLVPFHGW